MVASGAGAEMRRSLGIAVFSGMLGVTMFGIFLTPVFFYVITRVGETSLFASPAFQRIGSALVGAALGGAIGYLLALLELVLLPWGPLVGAAIGVMIVVSLTELRRRFAPVPARVSRGSVHSHHDGQAGGTHPC
jgi:multidrug efflux pump